MNQLEPQMTQLRLYGMSRYWKSLLETRRTLELSLPEGLEVLLQAEAQERSNNRFQRLQKNARFRYQASIEELLPDASRGMRKEMITELATGEYITQGGSVLITGAAGCGKSFLASALGHQACAQGYSVLYFNVQKLLLRAKMARAEGASYKFFDRLAKTHLLILDDFGLARLDQQQQLDFMELLEDRHACHATVIVSQLPVENWYDIIGEETLADAIMDRLVHTSCRMELKGESIRKKR